MVVTLFIYLLALSCWLGGMLFFTVFTAPAVFAVLPVVDAGKVVSTIFPRYYMLGYVAGTLTLILALYFAAIRTSRGWWMIVAAALLGAFVLTLYAGAVVRPRVNAIRAVSTDPHPDPAQKAEFDRLHRLSVILNGGVMILNVVALIGSAAALA